MEENKDKNSIFSKRVKAGLMSLPEKNLLMILKYQLKDNYIFLEL